MSLDTEQTRLRDSERDRRWALALSIVGLALVLTALVVIASRTRTADYYGALIAGGAAIVITGIDAWTGALKNAPVLRPLAGGLAGGAALWAAYVVARVPGDAYDALQKCERYFDTEKYRELGQCIQEQHDVLRRLVLHVPPAWGFVLIGGAFLIGVAAIASARSKAPRERGAGPTPAAVGLLMLIGLAAGFVVCAAALS